MLAAALLVFLQGCSKEPKPGGESKGEKAMKPVAAHPSGSASAAGDGLLKFAAPAEWIAETPASSMRKAQYRLPRVQGDPEDAELAVFFFGGSGGPVQANIDRWIGQFRKADGSPANDAAKTTRRESHGIALTLVDVSGTFLAASGPMLAEKQTKPGFRMIAAVAEAPAGPWFFKLTGPAPTVGKWEPEFQKFLTTIRQ
jgi:hypothetical protein